MLNFGNKEFRNLQEQVLKNMNDISDIVNAERVLADFGIKVLGWFESEQALKEAYPEETTTGLEYGDAFAIHEVDRPPYEFYIWTRTEEEGKNGIWFNIGEFPKEGPQGEQGLPGEKGEKGDKGDRGEQGLRGPIGPTGPRGEKGETGENGLQGPKGDKGETGGLIEIIGILDDSQDLPDPVVLDKPDAAYLITNPQSTYDLWIQVGESMADRQWVDVGQFNKGTAIKINDEIVPVYDATHVVNTEQIVADDVNNIITINTSRLDMPSQGDTTTWKFRPSNGNTFTILNNTTDVVSLGTSSIRINTHLLPASGSNKNLGINDDNYRWNNLYLSGTANIGGATIKEVDSVLEFNEALVPLSNNSRSLGTTGKKWKDLYLSGSVIGANNVFNVINASDIPSTRVLTDEQIAIITNGKPTLIIGGAVKGYTNVILYPSYNDFGTFYSGHCSYNSNLQNYEDVYTIYKASKTIDFGGYNYINIQSVNTINGKAFVREHIINVNATTNAGTYHCQFSFDAHHTTKFNTTGEIASYLYGKNETMRIPVSGTYVASGVKYLITGISTQLNGSQKELVFEFINLADGSDFTISSYGLEVVDTII